MPRITALHERPGDRVAVELDDTPWRTLPATAVVRAGLSVGAELDRPRARVLAREVRRCEAIERAARSLARRDLSRQVLDERLARAGHGAPAREAALATLTRAGALDDERFARGRATALAERGWGDAAIRWRLERDGVAEGGAQRAVDELEPEQERARRVVMRRGATSATARLLARRGFGEDAVDGALAGMGGMPSDGEVG